MKYFTVASANFYYLIMTHITCKLHIQIKLHVFGLIQVFLMLVHRQALFLHRQALIEQLKESEDPALVLHLTSVLLFQASTQCMLHAPGRCVPQIISILTGRIPTVSKF